MLLIHVWETYRIGHFLVFLHSLGLRYPSFLARGGGLSFEFFFARNNTKRGLIYRQTSSEKGDLSLKSSTPLPRIREEADLLAETGKVEREEMFAHLSEFPPLQVCGCFFRS